MKTKAVFSTATQTNSRSKEKQLHLLALQQAIPLLIFRECQDSPLFWCNLMWQGRENGEFMLGVTISPKSQLLHSEQRVFWPFYSSHLPRDITDLWQVLVASVLHRGMMLSMIHRISSCASALVQPGQTEPDQKAGTDLTGTDQLLSQGLANWKMLLLFLKITNLIALAGFL